jgi:hypothetical protein
VFASLHVTNIYSNIPIMKTKRNLKNLTFNPTGNKISTDILHCYDIVTKQNYFAHRDKVITQTDGLAMGAPS